MSDRTFIIYILLLIIGAAVVMYTHTHIEPKTGIIHTHPTVALLSDREQERTYCLAYLTGMPVDGATDRQVREHCKQYTY